MIKKYKYIPITLILIVAAFSWSCKKHTLNEVLPVVKMISAEKLGTDSVIVKGTIVSDNGDILSYEGFCYGTNPVPSITQNQILLKSDSTNFSAHVFVNKDSTYYFRCFAANSFGYAASSPMK